MILIRMIFATLALALGIASPVPALAQASQAAATPPAKAKATFAGGCFWCMEEAFDAIPGVIATVSGYMGGKTGNPSYEQVSTGRTGHAEVIQIEYDPSRVSYEKLLEAFWRNIDPTQRNGQFCDHGSQYRSGIFYHNDEQKRLAESSRAALVANKPFKGEVVTEIVPAAQFYPAEDYHQDYYTKNPVRYKFYNTGCGRAARLKELWG